MTVYLGFNFQIIAEVSLKTFVEQTGSMSWQVLWMGTLWNSVTDN